MTFTFTKIVKTELVGCKLCRDIYFRPNRPDLIENHLKNEHKINFSIESDSGENDQPKPQEKISVEKQQNTEPAGSKHDSALTAVRRKSTNAVSGAAKENSAPKRKNQKRKLSALSQLKQEKVLNKTFRPISKYSGGPFFAPQNLKMLKIVQKRGR